MGGRAGEGSPRVCDPGRRGRLTLCLAGAEDGDGILTGPVIKVTSETDIFRALGLAYVPPHMRDLVH